MGAGQGEGLPPPNGAKVGIRSRRRHSTYERMAWHIFDFALPRNVIKSLLKFVIIEETSLSMTSTTAQRVRALDLLKSRGMLRLKDFMAEGIGPETLARLVREAAVVRPARGLYQLPDTQIEAAHILAEAAVLVPKGVVCLTSALQYHELTLQMPSAGKHGDSVATDHRRH